ncbi:DEAD-domain-containing protein [Punctularia strigosozonata HHB-11173 SS5]|uniref:DEAD-domain-containing protein n=1 Tax=Punctularia strigosozonata (strain HHB-11173) TaxID=741275 RepID=UPI0004416C6F|nr:DEAD-domain-containing protein [Punctularia strigosozonata HHB-11173 SS5]EIN11282.1 DEAD-domain-containing protein [Punctularia strigosozonata HHB-11173 SS5]
MDMSTFTGLGLDPLIATFLTTKMNIAKPTSIQRAALPALIPRSGEEPNTRDVFIQAQTGSGKTLAFLLPIIQDLLSLSTLSWIDRSIGTLAIIIAPTRELAKQIYDVLEALLKMRLRPEDANADDPTSQRMTRWIVPGLLTGGADRNHEKARLRKGVPILVATPGRLLDHLQNTSSFNVGKCRWLVLDEADRLMELGFEETITGILKALEGRRKLAIQAVKEGKSLEPGGWDWDRRRRTLLCSATIREDVQKLAGVALNDPLVVKATVGDKSDNASSATPAALTGDESAISTTTKFTPPSQLSQKYVVVPLKLRLVTLVALLRSILAQSEGSKRTCKIIVFFSCTDSVDFHWRLLGGTRMGGTDQQEKGDSDENEDSDDEDDDTEGDKKPRSKGSHDDVEAKSPLLPRASIYRLHGSLPLPTRQASLKGFAHVPRDQLSTPNHSSSSILFCTSVASRGLDLPFVRAVVQYDLPTEGGATEYIHRVGRTARVGKGGEAWSFVLPSEVQWVQWVERKMAGDATAGEKQRDQDQSVSLQAVANESVLSKGFSGGPYHERATEVQLAFERWVLRSKEHLALASQGFSSHVRAYATHPSDEKHIFHIRNLHLGHLAKSFALREPPSMVKKAKQSAAKAGKKSKPADGAKKANSSATKQPEAHRKSTKEKQKNWEEDHDKDAEKRMREAVRAQGKTLKKAGVLMSNDTGEFQLASGDMLEKLVRGG